MQLQKNIPSVLALVMAFVLLSGLMGVTARAAVLYTETFTTGSYVTYSTYSTNAGYGANPWKAYDDTYHQDLSNNASYYTGTGTDSVGIVAANDKHGTAGIAAVYNASTANGDIFNVFRSGLSIVNPGSLTFDAMRRTTDNTATLQLMVQVGSQWYVSSVITTPTGAGAGSSFFQANASTITFDFTTNTSWYTYTPTFSTSMTANLSGSPVTVDMSQQTLTGIGMYATVGTSQALYFDNLVVDSVPEPTIAMLLGMGAFGMLWQLNRRRRV